MRAPSRRGPTARRTRATDARPAKRVEIRGKDLDRNVAVVLDVVREIDARHGSVPKGALRDVAADEGDTELLGSVREDDDAPRHDRAPRATEEAMAAHADADLITPEVEADPWLGGGAGSFASMSSARFAALISAALRSRAARSSCTR